MYQYNAKVLRVIDGDSYVLEIDLGFEVFKRTKARLYGVDTYETYGVKKESEEYAKGKAATEFVEKWFEGKTLVITSHKAPTFLKGKYGRWLVDIVDQDGNVLSEALITEGHGVAESYQL